MGYTAIVFLSVFVLVVSASRLMKRRTVPPALARLEQGEPAGSPARSFERLLSVLQRAAPKTEKDMGVIRSRLALAGFRETWHVDVLYATKVLLVAALLALVLGSGVYRYNALLAGLPIVLAYLAPDHVVGALITRRQRAIAAALPDALDLLVICLDAGMGLDQAVSRVASELRPSHPAISDEFTRIILERRAGRPRPEAWQNFAERAATVSVRAVVATLIQAEQFGSSLSKALRTHSDTLRTKRRQQAEEQGAKTTVKLVLPLVFCVFPAMLVVSIGPSVLRVAQLFRNLFRN